MFGTCPQRSPRAQKGMAGGYRLYRLTSVNEAFGDPCIDEHDQEKQEAITGLGSGIRYLGGGVQHFGLYNAYLPKLSLQATLHSLAT